MSRADNSHVLIEAARRRSRSARQRTLEALAILAASGEAVTRRLSPVEPAFRASGSTPSTRRWRQSALPGPPTAR
jgi:hypothetical protein